MTSHKTIEETLNSFSLVVICGGQSSRLGTDKGLYSPLGRESIVERLLKLLAHYLGEIVLVTKDKQQMELYQGHLGGRYSDKLKFVTDNLSAHSQAALVGIYAGIKKTNSKNAIIMPVDAVGIRPTHMRALAEAHLNATNTVTAFEETDKGLIPFPSAWVKEEALTLLEDLLEARSFGVQRAIHTSNPQIISTMGYENELSLNCNTVEDFKNYFGSPLIDPFGRKLTYLRFSLTEACNLSCTYCLPDGFAEWKRHKAHLKIPQIETLIKGFRSLGFSKIRFTGGEPLVHPKALEAIAIARKHGFEDIALTTNAVLLGDVQLWRDAGLTTINISLDTLNKDTFKKLTKVDGFDKVLSAIEQAIELGMTVKINAVLIKGTNDHEVEDFIRWSIDKPISLRFIELMNTGLNPDADSQRILGSEIDPFLTELGFAPEKNPLKNLSAGPATIWEHPNHLGTIGFINPISSNFCGDCNRLRVQATGTLKMCLFGEHDQQLDLSSPEALSMQIRSIIDHKPEKHSLAEGKTGNVQTFRTIGG